MWLLRLLKIAALLTPFVPHRLGYLICRLLGIFYYLVNPRARRNIKHNLSHVLPDASWPRRQILALRVCITVVTNYYDLIRMRSVDRESVLDLVDISGLEHIEDAHARGRGVVILSAHMGNFSVMARLPAALGYHAAIVAERTDPPPLFNYMARLRAAMGIDVIAPGSTTVSRIARVLRRNGMLLVAGDRDVTHAGIPVRFFGTETTLPPGPVVLAMRTGASLVPAHTVRCGERRSEVRVGPAIHLVCTGDWSSDLRENLERMASELERMIARDPGQWAVLQRVWPPTSRFGHSEGLGSADPYVPRTEPEGAVRASRRPAAMFRRGR